MGEGRVAREILSSILPFVRRTPQKAGSQKPGLASARLRQTRSSCRSISRPECPSPSLAAPRSVAHFLSTQPFLRSPRRPILSTSPAGPPVRACPSTPRTFFPTPPTPTRGHPSSALSANPNPREYRRQHPAPRAAHLLIPFCFSSACEFPCLPQNKRAPRPNTSVPTCACGRALRRLLSVRPSACRAPGRATFRAPSNAPRVSAQSARRTPKDPPRSSGAHLPSSKGTPGAPFRASASNRPQSPLPTFCSRQKYESTRHRVPTSSRAALHFHQTKRCGASNEEQESVRNKPSRTPRRSAPISLHRFATGALRSNQSSRRFASRRSLPSKSRQPPLRNRRKAEESSREAIPKP